ncbi:MAG: tetratricopeptide repeat protein, partial [Planctomycetes bacterium]|nr:tetratricopeptide repeat protein [Planctomycetota bacterium]
MRNKTLRGLLLLPLLILTAAAVLFGDLRRGEDLLVQRKYGEAAAAIAAVQGELPVEQRARAMFLLGHARLLAGDTAGAITALRRVQQDYAGSAEVAGSRFLEARALERSGDLLAAAQIYRDEVERLVGLTRKEAVAETYLGLAEKAIAMEPAQHERATSFFDLALDLGLPAARAVAIRLRAAESLLAAAKYGDAIARLRGLLPDLDATSGKPRAMLALGRALRQSGDGAGCRRVLRDLRGYVPSSGEAGDAAYEIALSYGVPTPAAAMLDRAVAALRELRERHPGHDKARVTDFLIARCQAHCGRTGEALASLRTFLDMHGDDQFDEVAEARAMVGDVLHSQQKLEAAIAGWSEYLRKHPAHRDWERVQRAIVDAEFDMAVAAQLQGEEGFDRARELYGTFAGRYPLDARNPDIQVRLGDMLRVEKRFSAAREAYARCVAKYPGREESSRAQFEIGHIHEQDEFDFEAALAAYRAVTGSWQGKAQAAVQRLTQKRLELSTERVFQSDEQAVFEVLSRNVEKVRVRVYKLQLEDYFRATHTTGDIRRLDIEIIAPDRTFDSAVEDYQRYKETKREVAIGFAEPGAYVVKVDDQEFEASTMVLVSDLALISKSNRHEFLVFTQDTKEQRPRGGVRVVLSDGQKVIAEGVTAADGIYRFRGEELQQRDHLVVFAVDGSGSGASSLPLSGLGYSPGLQAKGYLYSDRPLYRPGQRVNLKGIVREVEGGQYRVPHGDGYRLAVTRPNGRPALDAAISFTGFGTFAAELVLPVDADLGSWSVSVQNEKVPGQAFHGRFDVSQYERPRLALEVDLAEAVVFRGEPIRGRAIVRHFYGEPAVKRPIVLTLQLPDGSQLRHAGASNAAGEVAFEFATTEFGEEAMAVVHAEVEGENVVRNVAVPVVTTELVATVRTVRPIYLTGESFTAEIEVNDRSGRPLAREATVVLSRLEQAKDGAVVEVEVGRQRALTAATGKGAATFTVEKGGEHRLRVEVRDRFATLVTGEARIGISGEDDAQKLRLLGDRDTYRTGETARLKVMNRAGPKLALLTWQGDGILACESRMLPAGESELALPIAAEHAPNFALALAMIDGNRLHTAARDLRVERDLRLSLSLPESARPGEEVEVAVVATDAEGRPVATELSLALVDEALLAIAGSNAPPIGAFFHGDLRETAFATASSCTWSYQGSSQRISDELLAEERRAVRQQERHGDPAAAGDELRAITQLQNHNSALARRYAGDDEDGRAPRFAEQLERQQVLYDDGGQGDRAAKIISIGGVTQLEFDGLMTSRYRSPFQTLLSSKESAFDSNQWNAQVGLSGLDPSGLLLANSWASMAYQPQLEPQQQPRTDFSATGAWVSTLTTDADGRATAKITLPHSTTAWQLLGRGVTMATEVGEGTAKIVTRKELQVDFVGPPQLIEGDRTELRLTAHNLTEQAAETTLAWQTNGASVDRGSATSAVAPHAELEHRIRIGADQPTALDVELSGRTANHEDAVHAAIPVMPFGVELLDGNSGRTTDRAAFALSLPAGREYSNVELAIEVGPDPGRDLIAAALGLGYRPQNCRMVAATNLAQASRGLAVLRALAYV